MEVPQHGETRRTCFRRPSPSMLVHSQTVSWFIRRWCFSKTQAVKTSVYNAQDAASNSGTAVSDHRPCISFFKTLLAPTRRAKNYTLANQPAMPRNKDSKNFADVPVKADTKASSSSNKKTIKAGQDSDSSATTSDDVLSTSRVVKKIEKKIRPVQCPDCDNRYATETTMLDHRHREHLGWRDHVCNLCKKSFVNSSSLNRHLRNCHNN